MKVLIVGSGGREHALAWALSRSGRLSELHAPLTRAIDQNGVWRDLWVEFFADYAAAEQPGNGVPGQDQNRGADEAIKDDQCTRNAVLPRHEDEE